MNKTEVALLYRAIEHTPHDVARMVEQFADDEQVSIFQRLALDHTIPLFAALLPHFQASILARLPHHNVQRLCENMEAHHLASLLRASDVATNQKIVEAISQKKKRYVTRLLDYSDTSVGAWMTPNIQMIAEDYSCQQAYQKALRMPADLARVMVVNTSKQLVGTVPMAALLRIRQSPQAVHTIMQTVPFSFPAKLSLTQAIQHVCWQTEDWVPVVDAQNCFVGIVREQQLKHALHGIQQRSNTTPSSSIATLGSWYGDNLLAFARLLLLYLGTGTK